MVLLRDVPEELEEQWLLDPLLQLLQPEILGTAELCSALLLIGIEVHVVSYASSTLSLISEWHGIQSKQHYR